MRYIIAALYRYLLLLVMFLLIWIFPGNAAAQEAEPSLTVTGTAERSVFADLVELEIMITAEDTTLQGAKADHDRRATAVLATLAELGLSEQNYRTSRFSITENDMAGYYGMRPADPPAGPRFRASQQLTVILADIENWEILMNRLLEAGASGVRDVEFRYSRADSLRAVLRSEATRNARSRAEDLANGLGVNITGVISGTDQLDPWRTHLRDVTATFQDDFANVTLAVFPPGIPTTAPGTIEFREVVTVTFAIRPD